MWAQFPAPTSAGSYSFRGFNAFFWSLQAPVHLSDTHTLKLKNIHLFVPSMVVHTFNSRTQRQRTSLVYIFSFQASKSYIVITLCLKKPKLSKQPTNASKIKFDLSDNKDENIYQCIQHISNPKSFYFLNAYCSSHTNSKMKFQAHNWEGTESISFFWTMFVPPQPWSHLFFRRKEITKK